MNIAFHVIVNGIIYTIPGKHIGYKPKSKCKQCNNHNY